MSSNPEPSYVSHDILAHLNLKYFGKTNGARASGFSGLSGKANQL